ncbi:MAG: exosortase A [Alphaproteobacteria bacterium]|nr:MAG: exosortase A [Alphaproteobacteria bacterium]
MHDDTAVIPEAERLDQAWIRAGVIWALVVVALIVSFGNTAATMVSTWWNSASYNHCFLVPLISAYLVWERRQLFQQIAPRTNWWGVGAVLGAAVLWLVGRLAGAMVVEQFALVSMIQASVLAFFGWHATRALILPVFFLVFAVPFGDFLVPPLQDFTAEFVVYALRVVGVPVYMEGVFLSTPSGDFHVAEACSGVRFLIATVPLGVLFADLAFSSWYRRAMVIVLSVVVPIVANGFRAFGIVYIAYLTDNEYATGVDHLVYGWIFFAIVILLLIAIGMLFSDKPIDAPAFRLPRGESNERPSALGQFGMIAVAVLVMANLAPLAYHRVSAAARDFTVPELAAPMARDPWRQVESATDEIWRPRFRGVDAEFVQDYERSDGARVRLYLGYYGAQREKAEVVQFGNTVVAPEPWDWSSGRNTQVQVNGRPHPVIESRLITRHRARLVWHWYWSGGRITANPYVAKVSDLTAKLLGGEKAAAIIAVSVEETLTPMVARETLTDFLNHLNNELPGWPGA